MPRGTTLRNIRVDDELWEAAGEACEAQGTDRAEVMRQALREVVNSQDDPK